MLADHVTPLLITYNEEPNIGRVLAKLDWARRILIVDSGSDDDTLQIARKNPRVEVVHRPFDSFAAQCNFGLSHVETEWVLSMDADYELSDEFTREIQQLEEQQDVSGFSAHFVYRIYGRPLRASLYPPRVVLYRTTRGSYHDEGHGHRVTIDGTIKHLRSPIFHDDRKPLARWLNSQVRYAKREAEYLIQTRSADLSRVDRLRKLGWPAPILAFIYVLLRKRAVMDGWAGWFYALQRLFAEVLIALEIVNHRLSRRATDGLHQ